MFELGLNAARRRKFLEMDEMNYQVRKQMNKQKLKSSGGFVPIGMVFRDEPKNVYHEIEQAGNKKNLSELAQEKYAASREVQEYKKGIAEKRKAGAIEREAVTNFKEKEKAERKERFRKSVIYTAKAVNSFVPHIAGDLKVGSKFKKGLFRKERTFKL
jgi:hypothetical protein